MVSVLQIITIIILLLFPGRIPGPAPFRLFPLGLLFPQNRDSDRISIYSFKLKYASVRKAWVFEILISVDSPWRKHVDFSALAVKLSRF